MKMVEDVHAGHGAVSAEGACKVVGHAADTVVVKYTIEIAEVFIEEM